MLFFVSNLAEEKQTNLGRPESKAYERKREGDSVFGLEVVKAAKG